MTTTFKVETGHGKSWLWQVGNNAGGIKQGNNYRMYESKEAGSKHLGDLMADYMKIYGDDIQTIRETYCQCGPDDWPQFEQMYLLELEKLNK